MTIWTIWKDRVSQNASKSTTCYVREPSTEQEVGVLPLPPVYEEKVGEQAV
jgi:hypothetical protein